MRRSSDKVSLLENGSTRAKFSAVKQADFADNEKGGSKDAARGGRTGRFSGEMSIFDKEAPPTKEIVSADGSESSESEDEDAFDAQRTRNLLGDDDDDDDDQANISSLLFGDERSSRDPLLLRPSCHWAAVGVFLVVVALGAFGAFAVKEIDQG